MNTKTLHIIHSHCAGPLERLIIQLCTTLNSSYDESHIVFIKEQGAAFPSESVTDLKTYSIEKRSGFDFSVIGKLRKIIKQENIRIVHSHDAESIIYATLAGLVSSAKCVHTKHVRTYKRVANWIYTLNTFIVCASDDLKKDLLSFNRVSTKKLRLVYNGIDLKEIDAHISEEKRKKIRSELGIAEGQFVIGNIARCIDEEDQASIIKALKKARSRDLDAVLLIAGDGPKKEDLQRVAERYEVRDSVKFLSLNGSQYDALNAMDCLVVATYSEGRPFTLLEAMAARKPVIATSIGANTEVIEERKNGYLVACGFPERIHSAIMRLKAIESLPKQIGEAGRSKVEESFTLAQMARGYSNLYKQLS